MIVLFPVRSRREECILGETCNTCKTCEYFMVVYIYIYQDKTHVV